MQARYKDPQKGDADRVLWYRGSSQDLLWVTVLTLSQRRQAAFCLGARNRAADFNGP